MLTTRRAFWVGLLALAAALPVRTSAQGPSGAFRFELEETVSPRDRAVEGYLYNSLLHRIGNVRVKVESLDANGQPVGESTGWVVGNVASEGRAYFYVRLTARGASYRASVISYDLIATRDL
jgi:hypothetical protein